MSKMSWPLLKPIIFGSIPRWQKKTPECVEYILVHEMVHLLERHHNDRFKHLMDRFMPRANQ
ncbi:YgjP-like metallopeptidase domain-containing protein [Vibrio tritonius]|uniref:YgjP-like metallopeptidase domain-containing protein n=1 Tax=Vibrio tritonius TaxID=1435069 RepID=UPI0009EB6163